MKTHIIELLVTAKWHQMGHVILTAYSILGLYNRSNFHSVWYSTVNPSYIQTAKIKPSTSNTICGLNVE